MKNKRIVRILSLVLVLIMTLSLAPVSVSAETTGDSESAGWSEWWNRGIGGNFKQLPLDPIPVDEGEREDIIAIEYPAVDFSEVVDDLFIFVDAPVGALPDGTEMTVAPVSLDAVQTAVDNTDGVAGTVLAAADITFFCNGEEITPNKDVKVTMTSAALADAENASVIHLDASAAELESDEENEPVEAEPVDGVTAEAESVTFGAKKFSVYAVVDEGTTDPNARVKVVFHGANNAEVATVYVKNDDDAAMIEEIVYDPGVGGTLPSGQLFTGWSINAADANPEITVEGEDDPIQPPYGADYDGTTHAYTIEGVREYLTGLAENDAIKEGDVLDIYAMIFKVFNVTYEDSKGITLASDYALAPIRSSATSASYTISQNYTSVDDSHHFDGWSVKSGASNISNAKLNGEDVTAPYPQNTVMTLSGDVIFSTQISEGHWLAFEENAYGATYNAPVFVTAGKKASEVRPDLSLAANMRCSGYTFEDWYVLKTGQEITDADKDVNGYVNFDNAATLAKFELFNFNQELSDRVELYARWTVAAKTKVTVIVWKQSVADDKAAADADKTYDYVFSTEITDVDSLKDITELGLSDYQNQDGKTITVGGKDYSFAGFKYNTTKGVVGKYTVKNNDNKDSVNPNGTTVVNLYYDRELITYNYYIYQNAHYDYVPTTSTSNGNYYIPNNSGGYTRTYLYYNDGHWYRNYDWSWGGWTYSDEYTGTVYERITVSAGYAIDSSRTMTGLYGQKLSKYGYTWSTDYRWFYEDENNPGNPSSSSFTSIEEMFLENSDFYGSSEDFNASVYHILQDVDGEWPTNATHTVRTNTNSYMSFKSFAGFSSYQFRIKIANSATNYWVGSYSQNPTSYPYRTDSNGWTDWLDPGNSVRSQNYNSVYSNDPSDYQWRATTGGIEFRYTRDKYDLTYMVGRFVDKDNKVLTPKITGTLKTVEDIPYDASLAAYAKTGANYYNPETTTVESEKHVFDDFVFIGWYIDETCTTEATFSGNMPENGTTVYGKWQQKEYRVFLHPNAGTDQTLEWGSENQQMNFKVANGLKISVPTGRRTGYEFLGWFTDVACSQAYAVDTKLNDSTVPATPAYDKTVDMTENADGTDMDKWGNLKPGAINKDVNRPWVQRKLDLYAKWSQTLPGASGIGVFYDWNGGQAGPDDTRLYKDNVDAVAQAAPSTPPADRVDEEGKSHPQQFLYWVMQKYNETTHEFEDLEGEQYHKYPGETFTVLKANALAEPQLNDDGTPMLNEKGEQVTRYTVRLRAQWGDTDAPTPTHIDWYSNLVDFAGNPLELNSFTKPATVTSSVEGKGWVKKDEALQINEAVDIPAFDTYTYPNYTFLGWAKSPEIESEEDLFLKWDPDYEAQVPSRDGETITVKGWYLAKTGDTNAKAGNTWVPVTQVAADENQPYDDLYAIWGGEFYVYHTGVAGGAIETVQITRATKTYDLTQHLGGVSDGSLAEGSTASEFLYGGYYLEEGFTAPAAVDGKIPAYDGTNWTFTEAQTKEMGTGITPKGGVTYYVKEVPADKYLQPYLHYTYKVGDNDIRTAWLISDADDNTYENTGFDIVSTDKESAVVKTITVQTTSSGGKTVNVKLTPKRLFGADNGGYLNYLKVINTQEVDADNPAIDALLNDGNLVKQFWVTPDGLKVTGTTWRTYTGLASKDTITFTVDANSKSEITRFTGFGD